MKLIIAIVSLMFVGYHIVVSQAAVPSPTPESSAASTGASKATPVRIQWFEAPPVIDGRLDDAVWKTSAVFTDFVQTEPGDNVAPSAETEAMIGYDAKNFYIAFRVKQDRATIRATVARRDNIFDDDNVRVLLDTFNDQRQAYILIFNPLGIQADGILTEEGGEDYSLDLVIESKGVITNEGYVVEAAIPFKSLRYEAGKNKQWGIHLYRRVKSNNNELISWMRNDRSASGLLNQAGHITGLENIDTTRQLEVIPSLTVGQSGRRSRFTFDGNPEGRYVSEPVNADIGITAKFSLTPTITLDFAYNPDFAQVEADAPVVTANQRFPIFFPEKRPFFLERSEIFKSGLNVVNTRAIVDPDIAAKLTGRRGKNTFGLLYASDNAPGNFSEDEREALLICQRERPVGSNTTCPVERFVDRNADIGVLRVKRDIGRQHNLGIFATTYNFVDLHNYTGGIDGRFRLNRSSVAEFQVIGTHTRGNFYDPSLDQTLYRTGNGIGYRAFLERTGRNVYMNFLATGRSRDYQADVGFTTRTDTNYFGSYVHYETDRDASKSIISKRISNGSNINFDWLGRSQSWQSRTELALTFQRQTSLNFGIQSGYERVFEREFGPERSLTRQGAFFGPDPERSAYVNDIYAYAGTTPNRKIYAFVLFSYTVGQLDYDLGNGPGAPRVSPAALLFGQSAPFDPGAGNQITLESTFRYQPTRAFQTQLNYNKVHLRRNDTGLIAFDDNIFSSRSTYQLTRNTFARLRVDYSTLRRRIRPQFVLGWTPNPGTALYVGYNDDINYNGFNPFTRSQETGLHGNGHTIFIKASYLFRKAF